MAVPWRIVADVEEGVVQYHLVEWQSIFDDELRELERSASGGVDVCSLAALVVAGGGASGEAVDFWAAVAGADAYRLGHGVTDGLQHILDEGADIGAHLVWVEAAGDGVVEAVLLGLCAALKFVVGEVGGYAVGVHCCTSFSTSEP